MSSEWFCVIAKKKLGPMTSRDIYKLAQSGKLKSTDKVRKNNSAWVPAWKVRGLEFPTTHEQKKDSSSSNPGSSSANASAIEDDPADIHGTGAGTGTVLVDRDDLDASGLLLSGLDLTANFVRGTLDHPSDSALNDDHLFDEYDAHTRDSGAGSATRILRGLSPGSMLGNYRILDTIGAGGMGTVLKAEHIIMDRIVAIKVLRTHSTEIDGAVARFRQEVRAAAKLRHSNVVIAYDADEVHGMHFLAMEFIDGMSLDEMLVQRKGILAVEDAISYCIYAGKGLAYAHTQGVIHRDVKPSNILLDKEGNIKVLDFGLAAVVRTPSAMARVQRDAVTTANQLLGTFDYMAPEQAVDARQVDHRADIYGLGCTMFRLLTGLRPYEGGSPVEKILAHRDKPIPSIREHRPEAPHDLNQVFQKMVAKSPEYRYETTEEAVADLEAVLAGKPTSIWAKGGFSVGGSDRGLGENATLEKTVTAESDFTLKPDEDAADSRRYFWRIMGDEVGPHTIEELRNTNITGLCEICLEGTTKWFPAAELEGLFKRTPEKPDNPE